MEVHLFLVPALLAIFFGVAPTYSTVPLPGVVELPEEAVWKGPALYAVQIEPVDPLGLTDSARGELAWAHALLEVGFARMPGVLPRLGDLAPPPGLDAAMEADRHLRVQLQVKGPDARLEMCPVDGEEGPDTLLACQSFTARWRPETPEQTVDALLIAVSDVLGRRYISGHLDSPEDGYIRKIATRAVATGQHLRTPSSQPGNHRRDPVARAVYLDASLTVTQWQAARAGLHTPMEVLGLLRRGAEDHDDPVHHAAEAWALEQIGALEQAAKKWVDVMAMAPGDRRFVLPAARAAIRIGDEATAEHCIALLGDETSDAARMRVELADVGSGATDGLLIAWQEAAPKLAEPVRRRIALRIAAGDLVGASRLTQSLRERGEPHAATELEIAIAVNLGDFDRAVALAESAGAPLPRTGAPSLTDLDDQLALLDQHLDRLLVQVDELAEVQNLWSTYYGQSYSVRCLPEARELRVRAQQVGTELREQVVQARELLDVLDSTLAASTVAPVLDPQRRVKSEQLRTSVLRSAHAFMAAVRFQQDQIEWRSRYCG